MKSKAFFKKIKIYYEAILIKTLSYWHKDINQSGLGSAQVLSEARAPEMIRKMI